MGIMAPSTSMDSFPASAAGYVLIDRVEEVVARDARQCGLEIKRCRLTGENNG